MHDVPQTSLALRNLFGVLPPTEKYEALVTFLEVMGLEQNFQIELSLDGADSLNQTDRLLRFEEELSRSSEDVLQKFLGTMKGRGLLKPLGQGPLSLLHEPVEVDPSLLCLDMGQADRFRLAALVLENENPGVAFTSKLIEQRISNAWAAQNGEQDAPAELPHELAFSNLSKTTADLERAKDIECVERLSRGSSYRLTTKGITSTVDHAKSLEKNTKQKQA